MTGCSQATFERSMQSSIQVNPKIDFSREFFSLVFRKACSLADALGIISDVISTPTPTLESFHKKFPRLGNYFILLFSFSLVFYSVPIKKGKKFSAYFSVQSEMNVKGSITFTNRLVLVSFNEMADDVSQQNRENKFCF